jgi:hypothetical protein
MILIVGIAARALSGILMNMSYRQTAMRVGFAVGSLMLSFTVLSHGVSLESLMEGLPALAILGLTALGLKYPSVSAAGFAVAAVVLFYVIGFKSPHGFTFYQFIVSFLVCLPLAIVAYAFLQLRTERSEDTPPATTASH